MAQEFEASVDDAVRRGIVAGGAAIAMDKSGKLLVEKSFGNIGVSKGDGPFKLDSVMWIASCTKLMTSIAALQCVERGDLALDDPISTMLPEWTDASIIIGYDDELKKPILKPATNHITLRHLLTHSAGMAYANPMISPLLSKCADQPLGASKKSVKSQYFLPLVYEPGESWEYGPAIDWAGKMVERANDGMKLGEYLQKHVWDRLGMSSTTFRPMQNESLMKRMVERTQRTNTGTLVEDNSDMFRITELEDDFGGDGAYSCARDYILLLKSLLLDDEVLLGREMSKELFRGQLAHPSALKARMEHPILGPGLSPGLQGAEKSRWDYSCGGALRVDPIEGQSGQGLLYWSGITNSFWFIDKEKGICGFYGSWLLPPGDAATGDMFARLQKAAYTRASHA